MNRLLCAVVVALALMIAAVSCSKKPADSGSASTAAETSNSVSPEPAKPADAKALITDDKIGRFIIYQKEMNSVADLAMSAGVEVLQSGSTSQKELQKALSKDGRAQKIADTETSALSKSGLTRAEATEISSLLTPYIAGFTIGDDEMKKQSRDEMTSKYGPEAVAVFEKRLPELSKIQEEILQKALGKKN